MLGYCIYLYRGRVLVAVAYTWDQARTLRRQLRADEVSSHAY